VQQVRVRPERRPRARQVPLLSRTAIDWGLMLTGIPLCLLARGANIFPLSALLNLRRALPLPLNLQARPRPPRPPQPSVGPAVPLEPGCSVPAQRSAWAAALLLYQQAV